MKFITVNAYEVALIFKNGTLVEVLNAGKYFRFGFGITVDLYDVTDGIYNEDILAILTDRPDVSYLLNVVTVTDNEIAMETKDGLYNQVLGPGKYGYWESPVKYKVDKYDLDHPEVPESIARQTLMLTAVAKHLRVYAVENYQKGILTIDGIFQKIVGPGVYHFWKSNKIASITTIDTRLQTLEILGQEILTKDKAGIRVNFQAQYQVTDIEKALIDAKDFVKQLYIILQMAVRAYAGNMTLDQLLANKESIGPYVIKEVKQSAKILGVTLISGGIKDIILPGDIKEIMNQVLLAQKKAQANTIMRHEETASTRSLLNTAKLMENNTMLMKLKEMEYMEKIAEKVGEISVNGSSTVMDNLKELFVTAKQKN